MGLIVKPGDAPPPPSVERGKKQREDIVARRMAVRMLIEENTERKLWDTLQSREIDSRIVEQVADMLASGDDPRHVRHELSIRDDRAWRKILAAVRGGIRVNGTAMFARWLTQNETIAGKMQDLIERELDILSQPVAEGDGGAKLYKGFSKELTMAVDAINRLRQGTVKLGKELGVFESSEAAKSGGQGGGVTIVVQSNIPFPTSEQIAANQKSLEDRNRELIEKSKAIPVEGHAVNQPKT